MDTEFVVPQGNYVLERADRARDPSLRAWDAADELALLHIAETGLGGRTLVVHDGFGALAVALAAEASWHDSIVALRAAQANRAANDQQSVTEIPSIDTPDGPFDLVVVKVPRTLAYLDDLLRRLRGCVHERTVVIGAGMTKQIHRSTIDTFERHLGSTPTSKARKKARLLLPTMTLPPPSPRRAPVEWETPEGVVVTNLPNVFSADALDGGTALLLDALPPVEAGTVVIDLACGNGVVGATLARRNPGIGLTCIDSSFQSIESARATVGRVCPDAAFVVGDSLDTVDEASVDLVVVNPPFHAGGARTSDVAMRMIHDSYRALRPGGRLLVVGNRHLGYHAPIRRRFGANEIVASNPQFVVVAATR